MRSWHRVCPVQRAASTTVLPTKRARRLWTSHHSAAASSSAKLLSHGDLGARCRRTGRRAARPRVVGRRGARGRAGRADAITGTLNPFALRLDERARGGGRRRRRRNSRAARAARCAACRSRSRTPTTSRACRRRSARARCRAVRAGRDRRRPCERLEAAGAVIFAKTATPEFCYVGARRPGTGNPHDPTRTPGRLLRRRGGRVGRRRRARSRSAATAAARSGSRPRSAASSASSRRSAPCRASRARAGWKTLVAYGPLARSVADARLMFERLAGRDPFDRHSLDVDLAGDRAACASRPCEDAGRRSTTMCVRAFRAVRSIELRRDRLRLAGLRCRRRRPGRRSPPPRRAGRTPKRSSSGPSSSARSAHAFLAAGDARHRRRLRPRPDRA